MQRRAIGQRLLRGVLLVAALLVIAPRAAAEPQPSPTPVEWELTFTFEQPQRIEVSVPGGKSSTYWYVLFRVVNQTGEDRDFMPVIERVEEIESELAESLVTAHPAEAPRIHVTPALIGVHPTIYRAIEKRHSRTRPFLVPPVQAITRIKQGRDNAIDSVAVFPDLDPRASRFTIYVGGLSGERTRLPNPSFREPKQGAPAAEAPAGDKNSRWFVIQKTLAIPYRVPGDVRTRRSVAPVLERMIWVMR